MPLGIWLFGNCSFLPFGSVGYCLSDCIDYYWQHRCDFCVSLCAFAKPPHYKLFYPDYGVCRPLGWGQLPGPFSITPPVPASGGGVLDMPGVWLCRVSPEERLHDLPGLYQHR